MAITITKAKPKAAEKVVAVPKTAVQTDPEKMTDGELADFYGDMEDQCDAAMQASCFTQFEMAKKELTKRLADIGPESEVEVKGSHWLLDVGVAAKVPAKIKDLWLVKKLMTTETFMSVAKVTLTDIKKYLNPEQQAQVLDEDTGHTDRRKITAKFLG